MFDIVNPPQLCASRANALVLVGNMPLGDAGKGFGLVLAAKLHVLLE